MKNITNKFLNENKRYSEGVVVTVPSIIRSGGGRSNAEPIYIQGDEELVAQVIEADTIVQKAYLIIDEAFPAGAEITVSIDGSDYFTAEDGTVEGFTVGTLLEDQYYDATQSVTTVVSGVTGDVETGKARVVFATQHPSLNNGQYAN